MSVYEEFGRAIPGFAPSAGPPLSGGNQTLNYQISSKQQLFQRPTSSVGLRNPTKLFINQMPNQQLHSQHQQQQQHTQPPVNIRQPQPNIYQVIY